MKHFKFVTFIIIAFLAIFWITNVKAEGIYTGIYELNDDDYNYSDISLNELYCENMEYLRINYIGTLYERTVGDGVTNKSQLYFVNQLPIYTIIDDYAYFPSGRNIYKIAVNKFESFESVGEDSDIIVAYRTIYYSSDRGRKTNIELAAEAVNGIKIRPSAIFSFNDTTGKRSPNKGYKLANVISNGEYVEDYGGGVCQVSSTIYAAVRMAENIKVTARKPHGLEVTYLPLNMDATVSYPGVDFKFRNNYDFTLELEVRTENDGILLVILKKSD